MQPSQIVKISLLLGIASMAGLPSGRSQASPQSQAAAVPAVDGPALSRQAGEHHRAKEYEQAIAAFKQAVEADYQPAGNAYNIACGYARLDQPEPAIEWLGRAIDSGFKTIALLRTDSDLDSLRKHPEFHDLVVAAQSALQLSTKRTPSPTPKPAETSVTENQRWPSFHGTSATGVGHGTTPTTWNVAKGDNLAWKTPLPGLGHSSPVVWGDQVFVTTATSSGANNDLKVGLYGDIAPVEDTSVHRWQLLAIDRRDGTIEWLRTARVAVPAIKRHTKASHANSTPVTDGHHVVALFGSEGLHCYDVTGKLLWQADLGVLDSGYYMAPDAQWGFGSSPVIYDESVIIQVDIQTGSFLAAFDLATGKERWRTPRDEVPTWSSPTVYHHPTQPGVIVNGYRHIGGYDVRTGAELWKLRGGGDIPVPTPVISGAMVYITNAHGSMSPIYAIRLGARGDISLDEDATHSDHIAWSHRRGGAYMQTPVVYGEHLYVCRDNGVLSAYDKNTGERLYQHRVASGKGFTASMVAADGKLYITSEPGQVYVAKLGPNFELLATNDNSEVSMATPAIAHNTLYYRTKSSLIAIADTPAG